jgi:adenine-specific DNA-methyltransferase
MAKKTKSAKDKKQVEALVHDEATRRNIPTAELAAIAERIEETDPVAPVRFTRNTPLKKDETRDRDADLDPQIIWNGARLRLSPDQVLQLQDKGEVEIGGAQLVWRGKDRQDWSDLVVQAPQLFIQEKVHPKAIIDDLVRRSKMSAAEKGDALDLFADFNGLDDPEAKLEFYQHDQHWSNRMILGDSLHVMASLAEREHLREQVQCIYFDPPYGIKFNSNWQPSTVNRHVDDGRRESVSREPEVISAFRDTWHDKIHSYLTYLRDRLVVSRELLSKSGSLFVQIGEENLHLIRALLDEVFGPKNFVTLIAFAKTVGSTSQFIGGTLDYIVWYARDRDWLKYRQLFKLKEPGGEGATAYTRIELANGLRRNMSTAEKDNIGEAERVGRIFAVGDLTSARVREGRSGYFPISFQGRDILPPKREWSTHRIGTERLVRANRVAAAGEKNLGYVRFLRDFPVTPLTNLWPDTMGQNQFAGEKVYVVQTQVSVVQRCVLMVTDPGDLVLDPTCGSGTTAYVAEQWGRRWITIDTSRVALALARARMMGAKYAYYYLADSTDGRSKEQEVTGKIQSDTPTHGDMRQGFVYERAPHVTLRSIANNAEIDVIWEDFQTRLEPLRKEMNTALGKKWEEWEIPRDADEKWPTNVKSIHKAWWEQRIGRQKKIDDSIAKSADIEFLYDRPYEDKSRVRVAGPFTVESLSPHRVVPADEEELLDTMNAAAGKSRRSKLVTPPTDFAAMVLENLRTAGVHQSEKKDAIKFTSLQGWPGEYIGAEGVFAEGQTQRRAGIFLGPEFGTVSRVDLVAAAREATEARFDVLIACAFNFDAHASELSKLGPLPILKAKMNPDLHMAGELKNTGKGNLFVVFGEPDIDIKTENDGQLRVQVKGVDVFDPNTGDIRSNDTDAIAAWFIDTDYDEQNFFVRHAYFLGAQDPYKGLKTALKAEVDEDAWATLYRDTSRPFPRPSTGRIAVKVINHFGDEVMKVFTV